MALLYNNPFLDNFATANVELVRFGQHYAVTEDLSFNRFSAGKSKKGEAGRLFFGLRRRAFRRLLFASFVGAHFRLSLTLTPASAFPSELRGTLHEFTN